MLAPSQLVRHHEAVRPRNNAQGAGSASDDAAGVPDHMLDQVLDGARVIAGVIASSLAEVEEHVTLPQLRVLVVAAERDALSLSEVAALLGVHASNATRLCDRLVQAKLMNRTDDPTDRRQLRLTVTAAGRRLVDAVLSHRRETLRSLLEDLPPRSQSAVARAMATLARISPERTNASTWIVPVSQKGS
jgi:DNA-binding MarR family transcriptional regulator